MKLTEDVFGLVHRGIATFRLASLKACLADPSVESSTTELSANRGKESFVLDVDRRLQANGRLSRIFPEKKMCSECGG